MTKTQVSPIRQMGRILCPCLVYYLINLLVSLVFLAVTWLLVTSGNVPVDQQAAIWSQKMQDCNYAMTMVMAAAAIPLFLYWRRRDRRREEILGLSCRYETPGTVTLLLALLLGASACILVNHVLEISGLTRKYAENVESVKQVLYQGNLLWELIGVGFLAPAAEELVFRGMTQRRMRETLSPLPAIVITSLLFAAMHGNFLQGIFAFLLGLLMGYVYERCHTLAAPVMLHIGANLISVLVSDTGWFSFVYENTAVFLVVTGIAAVLTILLIFYFVRCVRPKQLTR